MKRTLERELKALEIVEREANGIGYGRREIISPRFRCPRVGGRKPPVSGSEFAGWVRSARRSAHVGSVHRREEERGRVRFPIDALFRNGAPGRGNQRAPSGGLSPSPFGRGGGPSTLGTWA